MSAIETLSSAKTIIIKIGSVLIANKAQGTVKQGWIDAFAQDVHTLIQQGKRVIIVSSGAVALGRSAIGVSNDAPPSSIPLEKKQAASAVGQFHLFNSYYQAFSALGTNIAQVLLTMSETENRRRYPHCWITGLSPSLTRMTPYPRGKFALAIMTVSPRVWRR